MKKIFFLGLIVAAFIITAFNSEAQRKTRDLVFDDASETKSSSKLNVSGGNAVGVKTTMELTRNGKVSNVLPTYEFKSGDAVKLIFTSSLDGYVYWLSKGSSGSYAVLFPTPKAGTDNKITKNTEYTVPPKGSFRFDANPGQEELLCIVSKTPLPDIEQAAAAQVTALVNKNEGKRKTRDLVFDDEDQGSVNTKKQSTPGEEPFVAHYVLTHK
jgi:hypothetical protein